MQLLPLLWIHAFVPHIALLLKQHVLFELVASTFNRTSEVRKKHSSVDTHTYTLHALSGGGNVNSFIPTVLLKCIYDGILGFRMSICYKTAVSTTSAVTVKPEVAVV